MMPTAVGPGARECAVRRPGRPRSEHADQAIIEAALDMFAESGIEGLCIEAVAARAGVGKSTIYRRWPGKEELLVDALATLKSPLPEPSGVSVRDDLIVLLRVVCEDMADPRRARAATLLHGEGHKYPRVLARFSETVAEPRRDVFRSVLRRGVKNGEIRAGADIDTVLYMMIGAVQARSRAGTQAIPPGYAERVVDHLMEGLAAR